MEVSEKRGPGEVLGGSIGYELKAAQHALRLAMDEALRGLGVTMPQYAALSTLAEEPGLSNAQLARRSFVTPQTTNAILAKLEAGGLVERRPHPEHGRVLQAYLTAAGERMRGECDGRVAGVEERMVSGLSWEDRSRLLEALRECARALRGKRDGRRDQVPSNTAEGPRRFAPRPKGAALEGRRTSPGPRPGVPVAEGWTATTSTNLTGDRATGTTETSTRPAGSWPRRATTG